MGISKPNFQKRVMPRSSTRITGQLSNAENRNLGRYGEEPNIDEIVNRKKVGYIH
jgi:hypothetical protein